MTDPKALESFCSAAVTEAGLKGVARLFHSFQAESKNLDSVNPSEVHFQPLLPVGITGVVLLAESHVAIHTWPEKAAVTLDVYVCNYGDDNSAKARRLMKLLVEGFDPQETTCQEVMRGERSL
jgi:S-adenosylmethionine decarboxylase